jgi:hypothetical protein
LIKKDVTNQEDVFWFGAPDRTAFSILCDKVAERAAEFDGRFAEELEGVAQWGTT